MADEEAEAGLGHNSDKAELTDAQKEVLFFDHFGKIKRHKEKIATLSGELRALYKAAKADSFLKKDIDFALALEGDEEGKFEERRAREDQIARWMQMPIGAQADLFAAEPADEKAYRMGRAAGLKGEALAPPYADQASEQAQKWMEGWHKGQAEIFNIHAPLLTDEPEAAPAAAAEPAKPKGSRGKKRQNYNDKFKADNGLDGDAIGDQQPTYTQN